ncbi:sulfite exporter TauE/SafE family protein [Undibacterium oligocarboniphilum]|uniref:Probable membrane transporter protein n=1 Tax=Undibacterium oligocarboniphilum TaxID=666702 RepID=A0A850QDY8_9BURK|nr:sulfite exporter TauE/SafE family protein [Undibacterium oligocarboniphilum]MBC3871705.1 sulfite exporter TauE/SafE family protein [Undibacterium oligocarboniphilum]NVO77419.1 sulfite exporter TauE/SafE family protein [Undibacterium oligocarboniphilum]
MTTHRRSSQGFVAGSLIGALGGLIGLGGAEFRLPVLVSLFKLGTLDAIILNKAMSLLVVVAALGSRINVIPLEQLVSHRDVALNLLAGSLAGAWWAAGHAITMPRRWLDRIIMLMLTGLALVMLSEAWFGLEGAAPLIDSGAMRWVVGLIAGFCIGMVAALLGVAGGELLIPTIVLLYGVDIKLAGSLSLVVSLPTMIVGFVRYSSSDAFVVLRQERQLLCWMAAGSILGATLGGMLLDLVSTHWMMGILGVILLISAIKTFQHAQRQKEHSCS